MNTKCFVYGSLKRGGRLSNLMENASYIGTDQTIKGEYVLIDLGYFPGLIKSNMINLPPMIVHGEVYEVNSDLLDTLDAVEGCPYLYDRKEISLLKNYKAMAYIYNYSEDLNNYDIIKDGNW